MFGWSISASACRSGSKRATMLRGVHARLDDLEGDLPLDRLGLLGQPDVAHAAFAELLQQLVRANGHTDGRSVLAEWTGKESPVTGVFASASRMAFGIRLPWLRPPPNNRRIVLRRLE